MEKFTQMQIWRMILSRKMVRLYYLKGGQSKSPSTKLLNMSTKVNLIRFITMDKSFLLENHGILRAMAEFGIVLVYFYICDRTNIFPETKKAFASSYGKGKREELSPQDAALLIYDSKLGT